LVRDQRSCPPSASSRPSRTASAADTSQTQFLALEIRFLAGVALTVHPDDGIAYTYPLHEHAGVEFGLMMMR
jgi:hypothetical protein